MAEFTRSALPAQEVTGFICFSAPTAFLASLFLVKTALKVVCLKLVNKAVTDPAISIFTYKKKECEQLQILNSFMCVLLIGSIILIYYLRVNLHCVHLLSELNFVDFTIFGFLDSALRLELKDIAIIACQRKLFPFERLDIRSVSLLGTLLIDVDIVWGALVPIFRLKARPHFDGFLLLLEHFGLLLFLPSFLFLLDNLAEAFLPAIALLMHGEVTRVVLARVKHLTEVVDHEGASAAAFIIVVHLTVLVHALSAVFSVVASSILQVKHHYRCFLASVQTVTPLAAIRALVLIRLLPLIPINIFGLIVVTVLFLIVELLLSHILSLQSHLIIDIFKAFLTRLSFPQDVLPPFSQRIECVQFLHQRADSAI